MGGVLRKAKPHFEPFDCPDHGVGDPGIPTGRVQQNAVVAQAAGSLAILDHISRGTVLYRSTRIEKLCLCIDFHAGKFGIQLGQPE